MYATETNKVYRLDVNNERYVPVEEYEGTILPHEMLDSRLVNLLVAHIIKIITFQDDVTLG